MTSTEMLRARGICVCCGDNAREVDTETCAPCNEAERILAQGIAQVRSVTTDPTARRVMERSLRDFAGLIAGHGATEMSPTCDHCGRKSQGRFCGPACRAAHFSARA